MAIFCMPEDDRIIEALAPQAGGALTSDYVSLKNVSTCAVIVHVNQANAAQMTISIEQAQDVSGTGSKVITNTVPIYANQDCAASDTLVRQTDAVNFELSDTVKHKMVIFLIDPAQLDINNGFDCICVKTTASDVTNITAAQFFLDDQRYGGANPPSAVVD